MNKQIQPPKVLTIAGSDAGGSAGIQADLKTMTARGVFGSSVLTTVTAQNTLGVQRANLLPLDFVEAQLHSVLTDIQPHVIKTGLLGRPDVIKLVAELAPDVPLVVDPVLVNGHGQPITTEEALKAYQTHLLPRATVLTPNREEVMLLSGIPTLTTTEDFETAAKIIHAQGPQHVLLKGGTSANNDIVFDLVYDGETTTIHQHQRLPIENPHGIGCTLASAIASEIAKGKPVGTAIEIALQYVHTALAGAIGWQVGGGRSPVNHFAALKII